MCGKFENFGKKFDVIFGPYRVPTFATRFCRLLTVRDTSFVHPTVEAPPWKIHGVHRVSPCSTECYFFIHRNPPRRTVEVGQTSIAELCLDHRVCEKLVTVYNLH